MLGEGKTLVTNLPSCGVVTLNEQPEKSRFVLHALYASPIKRGADARALQVIEELVPMYDTTFSLKLGKSAKSVVLVPENREIPFEEKDGTLSFTIDKKRKEIANRFNIAEFVISFLSVKFSLTRKFSEYLTD